MKRLVLFTFVLVCGGAQGSKPDTQPLGLTRLQNSAYSGFHDIAGTVVLNAGHWDGEPPQPGSASVPRVDFLGDIVARGDLDGDDTDEAAVVLTTNFGGTGVFHYVAIVDREGEENRNVATRLIGDRIQLRDMRIEEGHLVLDIVRPGPGDPSCCPTEVVTLEFRLQDGQLGEPIEIVTGASLSPETLLGQKWRLSAWKFGEPVEGRLTLAFVDGRFTGNAGCNEYSVPVKTTDKRGSIDVGPPVSTRKQCDPGVMTHERRFLATLPRVQRFWFHAGQLALAYGEGGESEVMFLVREE